MRAIGPLHECADRLEPYSLHLYRQLPRHYGRSSPGPVRDYSVVWSVISTGLYLCSHAALVDLFACIGYTYDEKLSIARRFLLPKQLKVNGLSPENLTLTEPALLHIVTHYTREAGVRSLERAIGSVVRFKAVEWAEHIDTESLVPVPALPAPQSSPSPSSSETAVIPASKTGGYRNVVEVHELEAILGIARWDGDEQERELRRGVVYGLVVTGMGEGEIMPVETIAVPGSGKLLLTGSLGAVC